MRNDSSSSPSSSSSSSQPGLPTVHYIPGTASARTYTRNRPGYTREYTVPLTTTSVNFIPRVSILSRIDKESSPIEHTFGLYICELGFFKIKDRSIYFQHSNFVLKKAGFFFTLLLSFVENFVKLFFLTCTVTKNPKNFKIIG